MNQLSSLCDGKMELADDASCLLLSYFYRIIVLMSITYEGYRDERNRACWKLLKNKRERERKTVRITRWYSIFKYRQEIAFRVHAFILFLRVVLFDGCRLMKFFSVPILRVSLTSMKYTVASEEGQLNTK
jgi:hypothetical protein